MTNPQTIDKYQILGELGRGGFATVYRARDTRIGREVALKVIASSLAQEPAFVERFRQEALTAANLRHPNIVPVYDFGEADGVLYLAMALIGEGRTLRHLLAERGRLPLPEALPILEQLAGALDYLHERRLVHRDLKPANLMLEGSAPHFQVTLTDFGLARSLEASQALTQSGSILGTPAYMAPEQADPKRWGEITCLTDVYALGVLIYHLLLGRTPFEGEATALLHAHAYQEPVVPLELVPELGDDLVAVLLKALAKPPAERYPSAGALVGALQQVAVERERRATERVELDKLLEQARAARERGDWVAVQTHCVEMLKIDPMHPTVIELMGEAAAGLKQAGAEEAARRVRQERYEAGEQALAAGQWQAAIDAFEEVAAGNPDFREVQARLAQARDELGRAQAYDEAIAHAEAKRWPEACRAWLSALSGRPDYRGGEAATRLLLAVEGLLGQLEIAGKAMRQKQNELKRAKEALALFDTLAAAVEGADWAGAVQAGEALLKAAPDLTQPPAWLARARQESAWGTPLADNVMVWEKDGKAMARVPAGEFLYGTKKQKKTLPEFWIDKTPVTNAEYARFVAQTKHKPPEHWKGQTPPQEIADHPAVNVSWHDANAYAKWAGKRLPTEEEWEKAARGTDGREYPWSDQEPTRELCNFGQNEGGTTPVGKYSPQGDSPYGCADMSGNVWEWTASDYDRSNKVLRGGSWLNASVNVRAADRHYGQPDYRHGSFGFRCVVAPGK